MRTSLVEMTKFARSTQAGTGWVARRKTLFGAIVAAAVTSSVGAHVAIADPLGGSQAQVVGLGVPAAMTPDLVVAVAQPVDPDWRPGAVSGARLNRDVHGAAGLAGTEIALSLGASAVRSGPGTISNELLPPSPRLHPALVLFCGGLIGLGFLARGRKRRTASLPWQ